MDAEPTTYLYIKDPGSLADERVSVARQMMTSRRDGRIRTSNILLYRYIFKSNIALSR